MTNNLRYTLSTSAFGSRVIIPLGEGKISETYTQAGEYIRDYKRELTGRLLLTGADFQYLWTIENSTYRCDPVTITIEKKCGGVWSTWMVGQVKTTEAEWNPDQCQVSIKVTNLDAYSCLKSKEETTVDLFQLVTSPRKTMALIYPESILEYIDYTTVAIPVPFRYWGGTGSPESAGWVLWKHNFTSTGPGNGTNTTYWVREKRTVDCAVNLQTPWIFVSATCPGGSAIYARKAIVYGPPTESETRSNTGHVTAYSQVFKVFGRPEDGPTEIDNGMPLRDVITELADECGLTVVSDFFQINPENASITNYVTGQMSKVLNILVFQKSDIKRASAINNATIAEAKFKDLLDGICLFFNLQYKITGTSMRLEHRSYFSSLPGLDLTTAQYRKFLRFKTRYTYDTDKLPRRERFKAKEASANSDFEGVPIEYNNSCAATGDQEQKEYTTPLFTTDLLYCLNNPEPDSAAVTDSGLFMAACEEVGGQMVLLSEAPVLFYALPNNTLAWSQLLRDYHRHGRPFRNGRMNLVNTTFDGIIQTVIGEKIAIPLCCGDDYKPEEYQITALGNGYVQQSSWSPKTGMLELQLAYEADDETIGNQPPVANPDGATVTKDGSVYIDVLANDSDANGIGTINLVEVTTAPLHGTAIVQPDKKILYTPAPGYTGSDLFYYRIRDNFSEYSNIALVVVTVQDPAPNAVNDTLTAKKNQANTYAAPGPMANDTPGSGGGALTVVANSSPTAQGVAVTINPDGSFTYNAPNAVVVDTLTYTVRNALNLEDTATITINVIDVPASNPYTMAKSTISGAAACGAYMNPANRRTFYSTGALIIGAQVFEDDLLTVPAASCYLSNGTTVYQTGSGGFINAINPC